MSDILAPEAFIRDLVKRIEARRTFGSHPLWLAGYPKFDFPEKIHSGGWTQWTFYQHAGNVRVAGGVVDLNLFQGTPLELDQWANTRASPH